ncbi:hypothetical protein [Pimelobacter simplex]|uniref:hypothetical protein n=1 Tax=Nocardioides simplex TaxID=2045 RepID=UPI001931DB94|nr:hypothetical protein [Pimelobacter simplex]
MRSVRDELDHVNAMGDVATALASGRRKRAQRRTAVVALAAAAAVAAAVVPSVLVEDARNAPKSPAGQRKDAVPTPAANDVVPVDEFIRTWVPAAEMLGTPAPSGSVLARQCPTDAACRWTLVAADGEQLDLEDVSPGLAALLADVDPADVSLSYDGQWMAIDTAGTIRIQSLDPTRSESAPTVVEPTAAGSAWDLVGWGSGSLSLALAETDASGRTTKYATIGLEGGGIDIVDAPEPGKYGPVADFGQGVQVSRRVPEGTRVTSSTTLVVPTSTDASLPMGEVTPFSEPIDASDLLQPGETLSGPNGLPELTTPPDASRDEVWPHATVFTPDGERTGLIELRAGDPTRAPVGLSTGWQIVGSNGSGQVVEISSENGSQIRARDGDGVAWSHNLPAAADWVVPGIVSR